MKRKIFDFSRYWSSTSRRWSEMVINAWVVRIVFVLGIAYVVTRVACP